MSRTVAALYNSRAEAELARARLIGEFGARSPRIIAKDTAGAVDGLKISKAAAANYREGLSRGGHLLVTEVPRGANPKRVVEILQTSAGAEAEERQNAPAVEPQQSFHVEPPPEDRREPPAPAAGRSERAAETRPEPTPARQARAAEPAPAPAPAPARAAHSEDAAPRADAEELRVGRRAFTRETTAEEQVTLRDEIVEAENRPSERRLDDREIEAGGLFTERVFEIAEMREEPVVTKVAVVREEVIVRKRVQERTETVRDTVRHTEVELADTPASGAAATPAFFDDSPKGRRGSRQRD